MEESKPRPTVKRKKSNKGRSAASLRREERHSLNLSGRQFKKMVKARRRAEKLTGQDRAPL